MAENDQVSRQFDSMMAKLIAVTGQVVNKPLRARRALAEFNIAGVASVLPFHREMMRNILILLITSVFILVGLKAIFKQKQSFSS